MSNQPANKEYTHEASRYCHGDDDWTKWQPCTAEQAAEYSKDSTFKVRPIAQSKPKQK